MNKCIIYRKKEDTSLLRSFRNVEFSSFSPFLPCLSAFLIQRGALETARPPLFRPWPSSWRRPSCSDARTRPWRGVKGPGCRAWRRRGAAGFWRQNLCTNRSIGIVYIYILFCYTTYYIYIYTLCTYIYIICCITK